MRTSLALLVAAALAPGSRLASQAVRLAPVADAHVDSVLATQNFGSSPDLDFGKHYKIVNNQYVVWFVRGHVRFDLSAVSSPPRRARFLWYQDRARTQPAGCLPVNLHRITQPWSEAAVTWNSKPGHGPSRATASVGGWNCAGWKEFDVTALVGEWVLGQYPNHGFVVRDPAESTAGAARPGMGHSRESSTAALRPYLELSWNGAYGQGCGPVAAPTLDLTGGDSKIGGAYALTGAGLPASTPTVLFLGVSDSVWQSWRLPLDLGPFGFAGCAMLASAEAVPSQLSGATGTVAYSQPLPNNPWLIGKELFHQVLAFDAQFRLSASNAYAVRIY